MINMKSEVSRFGFSVLFSVMLWGSIWRWISNNLAWKPLLLQFYGREDIWENVAPSHASLFTCQETLVWAELKDELLDLLHLRIKEGKPQDSLQMLVERMCAWPLSPAICKPLFRHHFYSQDFIFLCKKTNHGNLWSLHNNSIWKFWKTLKKKIKLITRCSSRGIFGYFQWNISSFLSGAHVLGFGIRIQS